jgi:N-acetylneuraminate synthase/N,N'-diacetyllegionaminate synthase
MEEAVNPSTEIGAIRMGARLVGPRQPVLLAAEIGINHNGDMALAHRLIDLAADAGADAVKFQNYRTEDFISNHELTWSYVSEGRKVTESQYDMFKRCELSPTALAELHAHCRQRQILFFSTPTGESGVADLVRVGADMLKNGSDYLVHLPLIRAMAATRLPTILSTGMALESEIDDSVTAFRAAGGTNLVLLVCTSAYPTPLSDARLRRIGVMQERFRCPVGFSDHTEGIVAALGAVALGACMVEKHFTVDKQMAGPDHRFSADPDELAALVAGVRALEQALGAAGDLGPTPAENEARKGYRLSCVAARDLPAGHRIEPTDVAFRRPGTGFLPKDVSQVVGARLIEAVTAGHVFVSTDLAGKG